MNGQFEDLHQILVFFDDANLLAMVSWNNIESRFVIHQQKKQKHWGGPAAERSEDPSNRIEAMKYVKHELYTFSMVSDWYIFCVYS